MTNTPSIYVADLAAYNNAILHGVWIDATDSVEEINAQIFTMLADSPIEDSEEWAIHDYEYFGSQHICEYSGIAEVHALATFLTENPDIGDGLLSHCCGDIAEAERVKDQYIGCYRSVADYAQELTEETITIPKQLAYYIDYDAMARDMDLSGDIFTIETAHDEIHVFWNF